MTAIAGVRFRHRGLYLEDTDTVVVADLHLGRGHSAGVEAPLGSTGQVETRLKALVTEFEPEAVVFAGDVLDAFDTVPPGVESRLRRLVETAHSTGAKTAFIEGNHDTMLAPLVDTEIKEHHEVGSTIVGHGHRSLPQTADRYVIGHQHPAIRIQGVKRPCYLHGPAPGDGEVIVVPAFTRAVRGTVINRRSVSEMDIPLLTDAQSDRFRPIVRDDDAEETLVFPSFARLRKFL